MQNQKNFRWLLLRGLAREKSHWLDFKELLSKDHPEVLALDLPGFGDQSEVSSPASIYGITNEVHRRFQRIRHDGPWGIIGMSLGGMVALDWCSRWPNDFKAAVVINTSSKDAGDFWERLSPFGIYKTLQIVFSKSDLKAREKLSLEMISNLRKDDAKVLEEYVKIASERPFKFTNYSRQLIAASRFVSPEKLSTPLLFLASLKDHMVNVRCTKQLADQYKARIKFHSTAGHDLTLDDPEWAVARILEFEAELLGEGRAEPM